MDAECVLATPLFGVGASRDELLESAVVTFLFSGAEPRRDDDMFPDLVRTTPLRIVAWRRRRSVVASPECVLVTPLRDDKGASRVPVPD